jgi:hypothetical protein
VAQVRSSDLRGSIEQDIDNGQQVSLLMSAISTPRA